MKTKKSSFGKAFLSKKRFALVEIAIVLCSVFLVATLPGIATDQNQEMQKASASAITTTSEDDFTLDIYGNANEDDTIDMGDVVYIKLAIFGKKPETKLCDAKYDERINVLDVIQTKLIILGNEKELTVIDVADRTVTINKPVERVVLAYTSDIDYIAIEGGKDPFKRMVGGTIHFLKRPQVWQKYTEKFPEMEDIPELGSMWSGTFSVEKAISLKPNVVISGLIYLGKDDVYTKTVVEQLEQAGIPTIFIDYHAETIEAHTKSTLLQGYVLDKKERAHEIVDFYKEQVNTVYDRLDEIEGEPKPKVYIEWSKWQTIGNTADGAMVETLGGINIVKDIVKDWGTVSPEFVLYANPDVFIISSDPQWTLVKLGYYAPKPEELRERMKEYCDRAGWDTLSFTKNQRIYAHMHDLGRHIHDFVLVQHLAKCLYPDEFEDLDPEESFKEYHERFLPVDYSGVWTLPIAE